MKLSLRIWRQPSPDAPGRFERFVLDELSPTLTLLEALDLLNQRLIRDGQVPVAFESDCREGICGSCGVVVQGHAHGAEARRATCEVRLADLADAARAGDITLEPFRARAFPVLRDLIVDRSAFDRVIQAGGYIGVRTGNAPEANAIPIGKRSAERALDAAACIGCGACVAACPNASAALFVGAKVSHLAALPQGKLERAARARSLVVAADREGFGACTSIGECHAACPKGIGLNVIAELNREVLRPVAEEEGRSNAA
ncbi:MAG TPA: succinate dehydrogenase/fumarate reductase iron-sulfur subunit [Polyangiaceae bacterium]|nr:succinate dehydrogenase/fumarate reductase iron-sulfur subunit [Polyangiaceae bacterium]